VNFTAQTLNPSEAAKQLGITVKALRIYEERGLVAPVRTAAGWRTYAPDDMLRLAEIVQLKAIGLSLTEVARVLEGNSGVLERVLTAHEARLQDRARELNDALQQVNRLRVALARGEQPIVSEITSLFRPAGKISVAFALPWPWGGERFELDNIKPLTHIVGPLGSGKTRLAMRLAETIPGAIFAGPHRNGEEARSRLAADPDMRCGLIEHILRSSMQAATRRRL
jgi:DNA-binding transcriptional MerR regulator